MRLDVQDNVCVFVIFIKIDLISDLRYRIVVVILVNRFILSYII